MIGEAVEVIVGPPGFVQSTAQSELGRDQFENGLAPTEFRIPREILLYPSIIPGPKSKFEIDVRKLGKESRPERVIGRDKRVNIGAVRSAPRVFKAFDDR